mmetsp:Transcript_85803/g.229543  ORF Transcript_85803/g.229543 Transcript_85803/m.229543 type:complete len:211 (-) Transcript_85803:528-1160(-)
MQWAWLSKATMNRTTAFRNIAPTRNLGMTMLGDTFKSNCRSVPMAPTVSHGVITRPLGRKSIPPAAAEENCEHTCCSLSILDRQSATLTFTAMLCVPNGNGNLTVSVINMRPGVGPYSRFPAIIIPLHHLFHKSTSNNAEMRFQRGAVSIASTRKRYRLLSLSAVKTRIPDFWLCKFQPHPEAHACRRPCTLLAKLSTSVTHFSRNACAM